MKFIPLFVLPLVFFSTTSQAATIICKEIYDIREEVIRARTTIMLEETAEVTKKIPKTKYDHVYDVNVTILSTIRRQTSVVSKFKARSVSEDVNYKMVSLENRIKFYLYLDEMDQAGIEYQDKNGRYKEIRMSCEYAE